MYYLLVDVNPYYYHCGHYPDWEVRQVEGECPENPPTTRRGTPLAYKRREEAEEVAARLNRRSDAAWRAFLDA